MAKKKAKKAPARKRRRVSRGGLPVSMGTLAGAAVAPAAGVMISRVSPVNIPVGYSSAAGAAVVYLLSRLAPRTVTPAVAQGAILAAVGAVASQVGRSVLGLSGPRYRPALGYQTPVTNTLGYQTPVSRGPVAPIQSVTPRRSALSGARRAF